MRNNLIFKFLVGLPMIYILTTQFSLLTEINGATFRITNCTVDNVQAAINAASNGDTVELASTGIYTWNATLTIPGTKGITLKGPGHNIPKSSAGFPLTIVSNEDRAIDISCENNMELTRLTGLRFRGTSTRKTTTFILVHGRGRGKANLGAFRIDNCYFDSISLTPPWPMVILVDGDAGELTGLIDNCTFHDMHEDTYTIGVRQCYAGDGSRCLGRDSWNRPFTYGDNRFLFVEDNLFENFSTYSRHTISTDGCGGRFVARYNTFDTEFSATDYIDSHGDGCWGNGSGGRGGEIYGNNFQGTDKHVERNINLRGGHWLVYDNTFTSLGSYKTIAHLVDYRAWTYVCSAQVQYPSPCDSGMPKCATPSDFAALYPLPGQIQNTYFWNNLFNGVNQLPMVQPGNYVPVYIKENRDYWVSESKPSALAYYSPYTYPHPLRGENNTAAMGTPGTQ